LVGKLSVKKEIRIIGFDDAPFRFGQEKTRIIGTVFRGGLWLDGLITSHVAVDGTDSTRRIVESVIGSAHMEQTRIIMLDGITFGGFNVTDIGEINKKTGIPVIAVVRDRPDMESIKKALERFPDSEKRWELISSAGKIHSLGVENPKTGTVKNICFQKRGIGTRAAQDVLRVSSTRSFIPEPLRVAHIIGKGLGAET